MLYRGFCSSWRSRICLRQALIEMPWRLTSKGCARCRWAPGCKIADAWLAGWQVVGCVTSIPQHRAGRFPGPRRSRSGKPKHWCLVGPPGAHDMRSGEAKRLFLARLQELMTQGQWRVIGMFPGRLQELITRG